MDVKHTKYHIFKGDNYPWWKHRMEHYVKSIDYECWVIIQKGPLDITVTNYNGTSAVKSEDNYLEADYRKVEKNSKAMSILQYGIGEQEINRISGCTSAKEIWETLSLAYEETSQVKKHRIDLLMQQYEMFNMMKDESINGLSSLFSNIVNELQSLGRELKCEDIVRKILYSLSDKWKLKVTAIEDAKDLSKLPLDKLMGSLMVHELTLVKRSGEFSKARGFTLKSTSSDEEDDGDDDQAMYSCNMADMINSHNPKKFNNSSKKRFQKKRSYSTVACFKCGEKGHLIKISPSRMSSNLKINEILKRKILSIKSCLKYGVVSDSNDDESLAEELDVKVCMTTRLDLDGPKYSKNGYAQYLMALCNDSDDDSDAEALVRGRNNWYLDSGCSRHMMGSENQFFSLEAYNGGTVTFGDNKKGEIITIGKEEDEEDDEDYELGMIQHDMDGLHEANEEN
ncbi:uncharacterized protein LOC141627762 [Silene latifolia]|uniref:uncharacterized protein LOC141627762 n=1 Tax=Silene latifolia TaxID=37657 RepID=UPI003D782A85